MIGGLYEVGVEHFISSSYLETLIGGLYEIGVEYFLSSHCLVLGWAY